MGVLERAASSTSSLAPFEASLMFPTSAAKDVMALAAGNAKRGACVRTIADVIAGLTEAQALTIHHRLMGFEFGSLVDPAVS
jgi:hypothetical protein